MPKKSPKKVETLTIDFQPVGKRVTVTPNTTILSAAQEAGVQLVSLCGGEGSCDSCLVRIVSGEVSPITREEQEFIEEEGLASGVRLACQTNAHSDLKIDIPPTSLATPQRLQVEGQAFDELPEPAVLPVDVQLEPPTLLDQRSDDERLLEALIAQEIKEPSVGHALWRELSERLRMYSWSARLGLRDQEIVAILPPATPLMGFAADVGTTKLAGYLIDLKSGNILAKTGAMNPQVGFGEDVVSRIAFSDREAHGRETLQSTLIEALNEMLQSLCSEVSASTDQIVDTVVVGNTAMHHLFAGLPVRQLGLSPYVPAVAGKMDVRAQDLGLTLAPGAHVYLPPNIAGYVGADHVAMLLSTEVWKTERTTVALDIGTNTEITLAADGRLLSCSCASGPAFEGAHIRDGMRAATGAIERVQIADEQIRTFTIGSEPPVGICGSGILDAVAELLKADLLDARGGLLGGHARVRHESKQREFLLVPAAETGHNRDIVLTRSDVNEIQLAKGAIRAGIEVLLKEVGVHYEAVQDFIVAGAFGSYLDVESAVRIGMFPNLPNAQFQQVGNAAGMGALRMLVSVPQRRVAEQIAERVEYVELTTHPRFRDEFMEALFF